MHPVETDEGLFAGRAVSLYNLPMNEQRERFEKLKSKLGVSEKKKRLEELSKKASSEDLWKDFKKGQVLMQELSSLKKELEDVDLIELYLESEEEVELESLLKKLEIKAFLSGKYDKESAILSIHAGQGGTEACDWASTLLRMYLRYAEAKGFLVMENNKKTREAKGGRKYYLHFIHYYYIL